MSLKPLLFINKNNINNYKYCKTIDKNTSVLSIKDRKTILKDLQNKIKSNPELFGIKNLDYFNTIQSSLGKDKVCNILYNKIGKN
jgi:hypothetical protein